MKKNRMMRLASVLMVAVMMTTCTISGTFAKYVTSAESSDSARVAKWGVEVSASVDGAFAAEYDADVANLKDYLNADITKTVVAYNGTDKLVAPGTGGDLGATTIEGTPEVAVNVKKVATLTLTGWEAVADWDGDPATADTDEEYCPIVFEVNGVEIKMDGTNDTVAKLVAAVEDAVECDKNYQANTTLDSTDDVIVTWEWPFSTSDENDVKDTILGNLADSGAAPTIAFELNTTVTQLD